MAKKRRGNVKAKDLPPAPKAVETIELYPKCLRDQTTKEEASCPFIRYIKDDTKCYYYHDETGSCTNLDCLKDILIRRLSMITQSDILLTAPLQKGEKMLTCLVKFSKENKISKAILGKNADVALDFEETQPLYAAFVEDILNDLKKEIEEGANGKKHNP